MKKKLFYPLVIASLSFTPYAKAALLDEIQVYDDSINAPGEQGLELHVNTTPSGITTPNYPGEVVSAHGLRITPEFSWGLSDHFESGLYVPTVMTANGDTYLPGLKGRLKWIGRKAPDEGGWFYGLNGEVSYVERKFEEGRAGFELRPIFGYRNKDWIAVINPVLEFGLLQGYRGTPDFSPGIKLGHTVAPGISTGLEYYADLGKVSKLSLSNQQSQTLFAVVDVNRGPLVFNFGVGRGLTDSTDKWTLKTIVELPF